MIYIVTDISVPMFANNAYANIVFAAVTLSSPISLKGEDVTCAVKDQSQVDLINKELGSNFVASDAEAKLDYAKEDFDLDCLLIAHIQDGKIKWFNAWLE